MLKLLLLFSLTAALSGCSSESTPVKLPPGATLEVYTIAAAKAPNTIPAIDPITGGPLFLQTPPIVTTSDVATVARCEIEIRMANGTRSERTQPALDVELTPAGSAKMATATAALIGKPIAVVINGQVVGAPKVVSPIQASFQVSGWPARFTSAIEALTKP